MRVDAFDFELPEDRIALRPSEPREQARLLYIPKEGDFGDLRIADLPSLLRSGDCVVVNDTRVLPAQLYGVRVRGEAVARIDVTLHKRHAPDQWLAFVRPAKKLKIGERVTFGSEVEGRACDLSVLHAEVISRGDDGEILFRFDYSGPMLDEAIMRIGHMPLPPYIASKREQDAQDQHDYQTIFAHEIGAVAAPTAGLHFTPALLAALEQKGVRICRVTLHVGAGTFLPVKADDTDQHKMHAEYGIVSEEVAQQLNHARAHGGRIIAIGTTSLRILESAVDAQGQIHAFAGDTSIFITPGYHLRAVDVLLTNFHLPRSTLFMLVSAFSGLRKMRRAYQHAIDHHYRFYSYGDACLLERVPFDEQER
jgi:S-adenosylmethionine:tRNA ribosyltransferase-isomerase